MGARSDTRHSSRAAIGALTAVGALAVVGVGLALGVLASGGERPSVVREAPPGGAWKAAASFGPVSVERVERFVGVAHDGHGHAGARSDRIRVSLTLANRGRTALPFSPGQFRLRLDRAGTTLTATRPNPPPGAIGAGQTLRQRLTFVVSVPSTSFTLVFNDLARATPLPIGLGAFDVPRKG
jgi:hypothetical protein